MEVIFVEGNSSDKTWEKIISAIKSHNKKEDFQSELLNKIKKKMQYLLDSKKLNTTF